MKKSFSIGRKLLGVTGFLLLFSVFVMNFTSGQASAAPSDTGGGPSVSECNKLSDPAACKQKFQQCDNQKTEPPSTCKNIYLNQQALASKNPAPPESQCDSTSNSSACKKAYEKCGSNDNSCKSKAISDQLLNKVAPAGTTYSSQGCITSKDSPGTCGHQCGADDQNPYTPSIDLGCKGKGNPIMDTIFGVIHFLSDGVGLIVIGSIIVGGLQYTGSRGDPQSTAMAVNRIRSSVFALVLFLFAYAIINYIIPGFVL